MEIRGPVLRVVTLMLGILISSVSLGDEVHSPSSTNSAKIAASVFKKIKNSHYKAVGGCVFVTGGMFPHVHGTVEIEQFLPDLVVVIYNTKDSNPYKEEKLLYNNKLAEKGYQKAFKKLMGYDLGEGATTANQLNGMAGDDLERYVEVVGSPMNLFNFPFLIHRADSSPLLPYYLSKLDGFLERTGLGEVEMLKHPNLYLHSPIGTLAHRWGNEIPRSMRVENPYRFRASVVAAMHAADIATNSNNLHIPMANKLSNSCGQNCVVANVTFDPTQQKVIWQEVFPLNRNIVPGAMDDYGFEDEEKGHGNYVFVVWRKYQGCIQAPGKLKYASKKYQPTKKR